MMVLPLELHVPQSSGFECNSPVTILGVFSKKKALHVRENGLRPELSV